MFDGYRPRGGGGADAVGAAGRGRLPDGPLRQVPQRSARRSDRLRRGAVRVGGERLRRLADRAGAAAARAEERLVRRGGHRTTPVEDTRIAWGARHTIDAIRDFSQENADGSRPFFVRWDPSEPHLPCLIPEEIADDYPPGEISPWPGFDDPLENKPPMQAQQRRSWGVDGWPWERWAPVVSRLPRGDHAAGPQGRRDPRGARRGGRGREHAGRLLHRPRRPVRAGTG